MSLRRILNQGAPVLLCAAAAVTVINDANMRPILRNVGLACAAIGFVLGALGFRLGRRSRVAATAAWALFFVCTILTGIENKGQAGYAVAAIGTAGLLASLVGGVLQAVRRKNAYIASSE
jgi:hypothetical protein